MEKIKTRNKWFLETFLPSFGLCKGKQISEKQGEIFRKYLNEEDYSSRNSYYYSGMANGLLVKLQQSSAYNGSAYTSTGRKTLYRTVYFLSIKKDTSERENEIRAELEKINEMWDNAEKAGASDEELDKIEDMDAQLYNELRELMAW